MKQMAWGVAGSLVSVAAISLGIMSAVDITAAQAQTTQQNSSQQAIEQYRASLQDGNPADVIELLGQELFKAKQGPKNASLERCDFGLGPGVIKNAYAQLPRYFADTNRVQDLESRLLTCMEQLQGRDTKELIAKPYSREAERQTELESLVTYLVSESRGAKVALPQSHPQEKAAFARGEKIFYYRAGPYDFSCASCHSAPDKRIRLQDLPDLTTAQGAAKGFTTWPAYRVSQGAVRTMQWRMYDCFRQQRFPQLTYGSQAAIDLITYLGVKASANGNQATMDAPAIKR